MTQNASTPAVPEDLNGAIIASIDKISSRGSTGDMLLTLAIPLEKAPQLAPFLGKIFKHVGVAFADLEADAPKAGEPILAVVDKLSSRGSTSDMLLTLAIPLEKANQFAPYLNKVNKHVAVAFADLAQTTPAPSPAATAPKARPYGEFARLLFAKGFFRSPDVRALVGAAASVEPEMVAKQVAAGLGYESMGDVPPQEFLSWANGHKLGWLLPASLKSLH